MQDWPIFCSYLETVIHRYSSVNYQYTARDEISWLRIVWTFCQTIYTTDILVYQLPFPLFCNFAFHIFKHNLHIFILFIGYCVTCFTDYSHVSLLISHSFRTLPMITLGSIPSAKISPVSGFPRKKWVPFINMHNGRVNDVTYCDNLGKKCVPPY